MNKKVDVVTCITWVPKGKAKGNPEKVELNEEDLQKIIDETKDGLDDLDINEDDYDQADLEARNEELDIHPTTSVTGATPMDEDETNPEADKIDDEFGLNKYDNESEMNTLKLGHLVVHASCTADPYLDVDDDSDADDDIIQETDNIIITGRYEGDASSIEAYVYNTDDGYYIHNDFLLPSPPLCIEWLNYDPRDENLAPGNLVAIGDMTPAINVWDMNCLGGIEPAFTLGYKKKRKKEKSDKAGHSKRVLSLAWNANVEHVLASGSVDETAILWDLQKEAPAAVLTGFTDKVQALKWNREDTHSLLTGCCDKFVRLFDCRSTDVVQQWKVKGEVESLTWDTADNNVCMASTDRGYVYVMDSRHPTPKYHFKAHQSVCSGAVMNSKCPGCLITVGEDSLIKVWDVMETEAELVCEIKSKLGSIQSVATSPDDPFVYSFGGDGRQPFKLWDIRNSLKVRQRFCPRLNLPVDDNENESNDSDFESDDEAEMEEQDDSKIVKRLKESLNKATPGAGPSRKKNIGGKLKKR